MGSRVVADRVPALGGGLSGDGATDLGIVPSASDWAAVVIIFHSPYQPHLHGKTCGIPLPSVRPKEHLPHV